MIGWLLYALAVLGVAVTVRYLRAHKRADSDSTAYDEAKARENCRPLARITVLHGDSQGPERKLP